MLELDRAKGARIATACAVLAIVALVVFSEYLSLHRIFQVDELQNVFTARILAKHVEKQFSAYASLMFFGPMMWLGGSIERSALLLRADRLMFFLLFWVNICLIVRCAGVPLRSTRGVVALLFAATLAPLWDYGFEIRHDNALLTTVLVAWLAARPLGDTSKRRLFVVGFVSVISEFIAYKAFAYVVPIALFAMAAAWIEDERPLTRVLGSTGGGALTAFAAALAVHWGAGTWSLFTSNLVAVGKASAEIRFSALPTLARIVVQSPALVAAAAIALFYAARYSRATTPFARESMLPEAFLLAVAVAAVIVNPTPFPYNVVLVTPQAAILALRLLPQAAALWARAGSCRAVFAGAAIVHIAIFVPLVRRHVYMSNERQVALMTTAEELTDPRIHRVFDGAALVPTRYPPGYHWLIHTFSLQFFRNGAWEPIRDQLAQGRTPVVILNYRVAALPAADRQFIDDHYVELAGDFLVAGAIVPPSDHRWECQVAGRYYIAWETRRGGVTFDGVALGQPGVIDVSRGQHVVSSPGPSAVIWVGPILRAPPAMGHGRAQDVFVNWY